MPEAQNQSEQRTMGEAYVQNKLQQIGGDDDVTLNVLYY